MQRRTYLRAVAGGGALAVCGLVVANDPDDSAALAFDGLTKTVSLGASTGGAEPTTPPDDPPEEARRWLSLERVGPIPDRSPVTFEVAVDDPWITPGSTASFTITTRNRGSTEQRISPAYWKGTSARDGEPGIIVYNNRARDFEVEAYEPPCFAEGESETFVRTSDLGTEEEQVVFTLEGYLPAPLDPGESRTETFVVADDPTVDGCFPPNTYRFERTHSLEEVDVPMTFELGIHVV